MSMEEARRCEAPPAGHRGRHCFGGRRAGGRVHRRRSAAARARVPGRRAPRGPRGGAHARPVRDRDDGGRSARVGARAGGRAHRRAAAGAARRLVVDPAAGGRAAGRRRRSAARGRGGAPTATARSCSPIRTIPKLTRNCWFAHPARRSPRRPRSMRPSSPASGSSPTRPCRRRERCSPSSGVTMPRRSSRRRTATASPPPCCAWTARAGTARRSPPALPCTRSGWRPPARSGRGCSARPATGSCCCTVSRPPAAATRSGCRRCRRSIRCSPAEPCPPG